MAPFKLIFTSVLVLVSVHIVVLEGSRTSCPTACMCLGPLVDCARQGLIDVPSDLPVWVEVIDLQNNKISSIDDSSFSGLDRLNELDLSHNQLRFINSTSFQNLKSFQNLIINHNLLVEFPELGKNLPLIELKLQHNEIHSLNSSILEDLPKLQTLDLSFNNLVDLPANTFGYSSSLHHLSLSHNRIVSLEKGVFDNLTSIESLKLSKNKLSSIPKELFRQMKSLQHLEINSNNMRHIDGLTFQGLTSLVVLKIRHSEVQSLQDGAFFGMTNIKKLHLDNNNIKTVTKGWMYGLDTLQRLYINNNNISEIEKDAWDSGRRIIELDMSHNKLTSITPKSFDKLYSLKKLILSDNLITYIQEDSFRALAALQYFELKNNQLSWTLEDSSKVFAGLNRLKILGLASNNIKSVTRRAFGGLQRLEVLNMTGNGIITIEENAFDDLTNLQELYLNSSSLLCDCHLAWMSPSFPFRVHMKCAHPENLQGTQVYQVPPKAMICEGSPKPEILKEPSSKVTLKGEDVTLECKAKSSGNSEMKFFWRKDGKILDSSSHPTRNYSIRQGNYTVSTSNLHIKNIQDEDEGRYQCIVSNHLGSAYSGKAKITVYVFPVFIKTPVDMALKTGSTARLECMAVGQPEPSIIWQKDGGDFPAASERRMHLIPTDHVFFIMGVKASDSGVYSCTAKSVAGTIVANATLTVLETPTFVKKMEDKEIQAGETAVLECMAGGSPRPKLVWTKDGGPLHATERHFFTAGNQLLIIVQTQRADAGTYTCEMSNSLGTERGSSQLKVLEVAYSGSPVERNHTTTGIIVIAVVICVVGTSIVWVVIIYQTRKRPEEYPQPPASSSVHSSDLGPYGSCSGMCPKDFKKPSGRNVFLDSHSGHSKDSGTGDSGQQSGDDLLLEDDHDLLIESHATSNFSGIPMMGTLLTDSENHSTSGSSSSSSGQNLSNHRHILSKEQVPLLQTFHPRGGGWPRSHSAEALGAELSVPPEGSFLRTESSEMGERDSVFSTLPRSVTLASVSNWSGDSPRFKRLPKDIPNDSGSFSMADEETQELANRCRSISALPTQVVVTPSRSCTCVQLSANT